MLQLVVPLARCGQATSFLLGLVLDNHKLGLSLYYMMHPMNPVSTPAILLLPLLLVL